MSIKEQRDIDGLRVIGNIIAEILEHLRHRLAPDITTKDLDIICGEMLHKQGATAAPMRAYGFPGQLCISVNDEVVHGIPGNRILQAGDLVKLDLEAEKDGYIADATITAAIPPVTEQHRQLIACAKEAFWEAMSIVKAGTTIRTIGGKVEHTAKRYGFSVVHELCGHGVGRKVHEEPQIPNYYLHRLPGILSDGLVITVEPILNAGLRFVRECGDGWTIRTVDHSLSVHYEHTLIVTQGEPIVVTAI